MLASQFIIAQCSHHVMLIIAPSIHVGIVQKLEISRIICLALTLKVSLSGAAKQPRIISSFSGGFHFQLMRCAWQNAQFLKYLNTIFRAATSFNSVKFRFRDNLHFADLMYKEKRKSLCWMKKLSCQKYLDIFQVTLI